MVDKTSLSEKEKRQAESALKARNDRVTFARWVRKRNSRGKASSFVLVVGQFRLLIMSKKTMGGLGVWKDNHLFELQIAKYSPPTVSLLFKELSFDYECDVAVESLAAIKRAVERINQGVPAQLKAAVSVGNDMRHMLQFSNMEDPSDNWAGGIIPSYQAHCNYLKRFPAPSIIAYIKDLCVNGDSTLNLTDLFSLHPKRISADILPLMHALKHNFYFTSIVVNGSQRKDVLQLISIALETNVTIRDVMVAGVSEPKAGFQELARAAKLNQYMAIHTFDFTCTKISKVLGSSAPQALGEFLAQYSSPIETLILNDCEITSKGMALLLDSLLSSRVFASSIVHLALSGNDIGPGSKEASSSLTTLLGKVVHLKTLELSNTNIDISDVAKALSYTAIPTLEHLDLSLNRLTGANISVLTNFLSLSHRLCWLGLRNCRISGTDIETIVGALGGNSRLANQLVMVDLASNELGSRKTDAESLCRVLCGTPNLYGVCLQDNKFKTRDLVGLVNSLPRGSVRRLELGCLKKSQAKEVIPALIDSCLVAGGGCLESLLLNGDDKRTYSPELMAALFDALANNYSLLHLDISNNHLGEAAMHRLVRALRRNKSLLALLADNNYSSVEVWQELRDCLSTDNGSLCHLDLPTADIALAATKAKGNEEARERVRQIWEAISQKLNANREACESSSSYQQLCRFQFCASSWDQGDEAAEGTDGDRSVSWDGAGADDYADAAVPSDDYGTVAAAAAAAAGGAGSSQYLAVPNPDIVVSPARQSVRQSTRQSARRTMKSIHLKSSRITFNPGHASMTTGQLASFNAMLSAASGPEAEALDESTEQGTLAADDTFATSDDVIEDSTTAADDGDEYAYEEEDEDDNASLPPQRAPPMPRK